MLRVVFKKPPAWEERITQRGFKFVDRVNRPSRAVFTIDNYDYKYNNIKGYQKNYEFCFGEWGVMSPWFKADIVSVEGSTTLTIEMNTMETRLMTKPMTRFWENTTLRGVLDTIAGQWGLIGRYDPDVEGLPIPSLNQINETDAQFLRRLAEMTAFNFWIDGDALCFTAEWRSDMKTVPYGELLEEPDFKFNFRKLRKKPKIKTTTVDATEDERDFDLEEFTNLFSGHEGPKGIGKYSPVTEKADSTTTETKVYNDNLEYRIEEASGTKEKGGPKHDDDETVVRTKAEAVKLTAKKVIKMTVKLCANNVWRAGDSMNLVQAPEGIDGQWFVRQHEYKWPMSTYELTKRGFKKKVEKGKLEASKENLIAFSEMVREQAAYIASGGREPNTSYDPALYEKSIGAGLKPKETKVYNDNLEYRIEQ